MEAYVTVVGASNLDISGSALRSLIPETSNPGQVSRSAGGVGRNIAHNLALLDVPVYLLSAVGDDAAGRELSEQTRRAGVRLEHLRIVPGECSGTYLSVLDDKRDLAVAVSDMDITQKIDPEYLTQYEDLFKQSCFVVLETNLPLESLRYAAGLCRIHRIPYLIEPVSVEKSQKLLDMAGPLDTISPNLPELIAVAQKMGKDVTLETFAATEEELEALVQSVRGKFNRMLVTLGPKGVYAFQKDRGQGRLFPALAARTRNVNGAGDAFVAGFVCGCFHKFSAESSVSFGLAAACLTLQSEQSVNNDVSFKRCQALASCFDSENCSSPEIILRFCGRDER
ncbi:ribokinase [candidate division KSB3 bacterium]|uniref:Ribokinase n=1 Tax=candidate division KSB3 bacterium TaxID=2044937 RepID=A0A2G6E859_9BACT|nr:MAG: ribokinase [candidate division KSB3 bacterium]PIE30594.1 MAG: ribokinase [candidate division KSB3 bacterium]